MYRPELHPEIEAAADRWREEVKQAGFEGLYLISVENFTRGVDPVGYRFDAALEFAPDFPSHGPKYLKRFHIKYLASKWLHSLKEIGRASCRERVCQNVKSSVGT